MGDIRNRIIQPTNKYQVWWFPTNVPEGERPHWELALATRYPSEAFIKQLEINKLDPQAEVRVTKLISLTVEVMNV